MKISNLKFFAVALFVGCTAQLGLVSCSDDPGVENYYTSVKEYAGDYLQNRDQFSKYVQVLQRATGAKGELRLMDLLSTWGAYTVFAPTNDAMDQMLASKGVSSVEELSKEDCDTIALNSIIEDAAYVTTDVSEGTYAKTNLLEQPVTITTDLDRNGLFINSNSQLTHVDDSVANGVVHTVGKVVVSNTSFMADFLGENPAVKLFSAALAVTHLNDSLAKYEDETYSVGKDSIDWTNDALVMSTATEYDNVAYMEHRYYKFTMFVCPDSVLKEKYGITDLDGLRAKAHELYDPMYPADAGITDETDRRNALNRFISYHILDRQASYYQLTCVDGGKCTLANNWDRTKWDIADWYETMMPHSIMKFSFPMGSQEGLYINRRGVQSRADARGVFVRGAKVTEPSKMPTNTCRNGLYYYIDDVVAYDQNTQQVVLNERMRIDASTLSPDFMTSGARGHYTKSSYESGKYGIWDATSDHNNKQTCLGFKPGSAKNFKFNSNTHVHVRPRTLSFWSYQGDEVTVLGIFDLEVKLPPVPEGDYELRLFTCVEFNNRGIVQVYIDNEAKGIPFDMRPGGEELFGFKTDASLGDEDAIAAFDKSIHNLGWMKGPKSYYSATSESGGSKGSCFRDLNRTIRKVLGTFHSNGQDDHYVRFQQKLESTKNALNFDFIEICPTTVSDNEYFAEDRL